MKYDVCKKFNSYRKICRDWQLIISIDKTYITHIGFKSPNFKYFLNDVEIQCKEVANNLGVSIRNDLSYNEHINIYNVYKGI